MMWYAGSGLSPNASKREVGNHDRRTSIDTVGVRMSTQNSGIVALARTLCPLHEQPIPRKSPLFPQRHRDPRRLHPDPRPGPFLGEEASPRSYGLKNMRDATPKARRPSQSPPPQPKPAAPAKARRPSQSPPPQPKPAARARDHFRLLARPALRTPRPRFTSGGTLAISRDPSSRPRQPLERRSSSN
jgi:hypothetical protein